MKKIKKYKQIIINIVIIAAVIIYILINLTNTSKNLAEKEIIRLQKALENAAVTCFSIEGFYPSNIDYLLENYGIVVDDDKYNVFYETQGANFKPRIIVFRKGK